MHWINKQIFMDTIDTNNRNIRTGKQKTLNKEIRSISEFLKNLRKKSQLFPYARNTYSKYIKSIFSPHTENITDLIDQWAGLVYDKWWRKTNQQQEGLSVCLYEGTSKTSVPSTSNVKPHKKFNDGCCCCQLVLYMVNKDQDTLTNKTRCVDL